MIASKTSREDQSYKGKMIKTQTSENNAFVHPLVEPSSENGGIVGIDEKLMVGKKQLAKSKNEGLSFSCIYFGFITGFLMLYGDKAWNTGPSWKEHVKSSFVPDLRTATLPLVSMFVVCPALFVWRKLVKGIFFSAVAEKWAGLPDGTVKHEKFCEQAWLAVHYTLSTSFGFYVLKNKPWFPPVITEEAQIAILATREERVRDQMDVGLQALYALQLGFYTLELVTLLMTKTRRSDAMVYFFHHVYTMFLMFGSWISFNHRIGTLVLILHDVGDIFLPIGKCYTYAEEHIRLTKTKSQYEMHKTVGMSFFVMFVIAFAIPRLLIYGLLVFQGVNNYQWYKCCGYDPETKFCGECPDLGCKGGKWDTPLLVVLGLLYPMHVYWFYLIIKMALRLLLHPGKYDDVRSDDEVDDKNQ